MKLRLRISVLILTCASVAAAPMKAQETPPKTQEAAATVPAAAPATQTTPATQTMGIEGVIESKVPGESKVPVAGHPVASTKQVKSLYIEPMANDLDQYLKAEFSRQLTRRIVIVSKPDDANAVMTGIGEWRTGTAQAVSGRTGPASDSARGAVQLLSKDSLLWASKTWGLLRSGSQRKVADQIVHNFKNLLEKEIVKEVNGNYY